MSFHTIRLFPACAALALAALAMPAQAQLERAARVSDVSDPAPNYVTRLNQNLVWPAPMVDNRTLSGAVTNLTIEALPDSQGRMTFGVGSGSRCAYGAGDADDRVIEFRNATGTYSRGGPIAEACPQWGPAKCSRSVTFMGRTFIANKGYPRCPDAWDRIDNDNRRVGAPALGDAADDVPDSRQDIRARSGTEGRRRGIFRVRVWGKVCHAGASNVQRCWNLKNPNPPPGFTFLANAAGYGATFRTDRHCGPPSWPTPELEAAGAPAYAEWCDVTVDVRYP